MKEVSRFHAPVFGARARPEWVLKSERSALQDMDSRLRAHRATGADVRFDPMAPSCFSLRQGRPGKPSPSGFAGPTRGFAAMTRARILRMTTMRMLAVAALAAAAAALCGCQNFGDVTGSIPAAPAAVAGDGQLRAYAETCQRRYEANPGEKSASIDYARALRALTRYNEAVAVMQTAAVKSPKDEDGSRRIRQGARRRRRTLASQGRADARLYPGQSEMGHHVGAGRGRRPDGRSRGRDAVLSRRAEDRAGGARPF